MAHERLLRMCFLDYDREIALLADPENPPGILAIGRMSKLHGQNAAEIAVLVRDQYQRQGLGMELTRRLVQIARDEHLRALHAYMLQENIEMQGLVKKLGFRITTTEDPSVVLGTLVL